MKKFGRLRYWLSNRSIFFRLLFGLLTGKFLLKPGPAIEEIQMSITSGGISFGFDPRLDENKPILSAAERIQESLRLLRVSAKSYLRFRASLFWGLETGKFKAIDLGIASRSEIVDFLEEHYDWPYYCIQKVIYLGGGDDICCTYIGSVPIYEVLASNIYSQIPNLPDYEQEVMIGPGGTNPGEWDAILEERRERMLSKMGLNIKEINDFFCQNAKNFAKLTIYHISSGYFKYLHFKKIGDRQSCGGHICLIISDINKMKDAAQKYGFSLLEVGINEKELDKFMAEYRATFNN